MRMAWSLHRMCESINRVLKAVRWLERCHMSEPIDRALEIVRGLEWH
jgi:hypothetical protein